MVPLCIDEKAEFPTSNHGTETEDERKLSQDEGDTSTSSPGAAKKFKES